MNCKPGDLAIIVRAHGPSLGQIVRCLKLNPLISSVPTFGVNGTGAPEPFWDIDITIVAFNGTKVRYVPDACLRPIRDPGDDAVDETLLRLPSPRQEVTA
ncbi:MAG: hypothetical protein EOP14_00105 [Pseudomonas sp.]|nr:MAG: hypothetical protein EOP14_00105 [Pseudomonas sp.]